jgi:hypothetical protein
MKASVSNFSAHFQKAEQCLKEMLTLFGLCRNLLENLRQIQHKLLLLNLNKDVNRLNRHLIKNEHWIILGSIFFESFVSYNAFAKILDMVGLPISTLSNYLNEVGVFIVKYLISFILGYLIIESTSWCLKFVYRLKVGLGAKFHIFYVLAHVLLLLLPLLNYEESTVKNTIAFKISLLLLALNIVVVNLIATMYNDNRYGVDIAYEFDMKQSLEKQRAQLIGKFQSIRKRLEFMAPTFMKHLLELNEYEKAAIRLPRDYEWVLTNRLISTGNQGTENDLSTMKELSFIKDWDAISSVNVA